jgi:hypothetical protein
VCGLQALFFVVAMQGVCGVAEEQPRTIDRQKIDGDFRAALLELAARCDELKLPQQATVTRGWFIEGDPTRQYLFIPQADPTKPEADAETVVKQWHRKFLELREQHAAALFALADQQVNAGNGTAAYQLLHEALWHDPDHQGARKVLAIPAKTSSDRITRRAGTRTHPAFGWRRGRYWRIESQHYRITTNHSIKAGVELAEKLEAFHGVWRQLFFRYWSDTESLVERFAGRNAPLAKHHKLEVVLFRDRDEYVGQLQKHEPQIEMSLGYYMKGRQTAFFYSGDSSVEPTWYHEATHQLFQELGDAIDDVGELSNFWIVEGIAVYMESLVSQEGYWTVGGVDADRLQYARFRGLTGEFFMPLVELVKLGREDLQRHEDIRSIYTQSAGLVHFLMDSHQGEHRRSLVDFITLLYLGRARNNSLAARCDESFEDLDSGYIQYLQVRDDDLKHFNPPEHRRNLVLTRTSITDAGLSRLAGSRRLEWLDLSFTKVTDQGIAHLHDANSLRRLSLEGTKITDGALAIVTQLSQLEELDLSKTQISDEGLGQLVRLKNLKVLWLTNTEVTDTGILQLAALKQLEFLDVNQTKVTAEGLKELMEKLPRLNQQ